MDDKQRALNRATSVGDSGVPEAMVEQETEESDETKNKDASETSSLETLMSELDGAHNKSQQVQDLDIKPNHAFTAQVGKSSSKVTDNLCCSSCIEKVNGYRNHNEALIKEINKLKYFNSEFLKNEAIYKKKREAEHKDVLKLKSLLSDKECLYRDSKKRIDEITLKLNKTETELSLTKITVEKFNLSSKVVEDMINSQLHGKDKSGIGFKEVEPPFNHNYSSMPHSSEKDQDMVYGTGCQPSSSSEKELYVPLTVDPEIPCVNVADAFESCAEKVILTGDNCGEVRPSKSKFVPSVFRNSSVVKTSVFEKNKLSTAECDKMRNDFKRKFVKPITDSERKVFKQTNGDFLKAKEAKASESVPMALKSVLSAESKPFVPQQHAKHSFEKLHQNFGRSNERCCHMKECNDFAGSNHSRYERSYSSQPSSYGSNNVDYASYARKQTCYACGKPGHIARNCFHRPTNYYYGKNQKVTPKVNLNSKPMKVEKPKVVNNQKPKVKQSDFRKGETKRNRKVFKQQKGEKPKLVKKPKVATPKVVKQFVKPKPVWKAKPIATPLINANKNLCLQEVSYIDASGLPRTTMAWVPLST